MIGDVHGESALLAGALNALQGLDAILCVGDIVDGPLDATDASGVERCIELLKSHDVRCVAGNHERWFLAGKERHRKGATQSLSPEAQAFIAGLPATSAFDTPAGGLLLCHGVGDDDMAALFPETRGFGLQALWTLPELQRDGYLQIMIGGHTHVPMVRSFPGLSVLNPGTLCASEEPRVLEVNLDAMVLHWHLHEEGIWQRSEPEPLPKPQSIPPKPQW